MLIEKRSASGSINDIVDLPPRYIVDHYVNEIKRFATDEIMGNSTLTQEQHVTLMADHLHAAYMQLTARDSIISNHDSFWRPRVEAINLEIKIYLNTALICTLS